VFWPLPLTALHRRLLTASRAQCHTTRGLSRSGCSLSIAATMSSTLQVDDRIVVPVGEDRIGGDLASEDGLPVGRQARVGGLEHGALAHRAGRQRARIREALQQAAQADPVIGMPMGDVDRGQPLAETAEILLVDPYNDFLSEGASCGLA
jgi:hypothetical protein